MTRTAVHATPTKATRHDDANVQPARRRRRRQPRLPIAPLEEWLNARYTNTSASADRQLDGQLSARRIGELVGVHPGVVQHWRSGGIPFHAADRAAINAGTHPLAIWPDFDTIGTDGA